MRRHRLQSRFTDSVRGSGKRKQRSADPWRGGKTAQKTIEGIWERLPIFRGRAAKVEQLIFTEKC